MKKSILLILTLLPFLSLGQNIKSLEINHGDHIIIVGNTLAERMIHNGYIETLFHVAFKDDSITFRNMGWSGDEITLQPRPFNFGTMEEHLTTQQADVIFLCFGLNESFKGSEGLLDFRNDLNKYIKELKSTKFNGKSAPKLILVSPIAYEDISSMSIEVYGLNLNIEVYTTVMQKVAQQNGIGFLDLYSKTKRLFENEEEFTINGIHLNENGYQQLASIWFEEMGYSTSGIDWDQLEGLREVTIEKNREFFYRWRAVNGEYIYGRRKEPFGIHTFPPEMKRLDVMIQELDRQLNNYPINQKLERKELRTR